MPDNRMLTPPVCATVFRHTQFLCSCSAGNLISALHCSLRLSFLVNPLTSTNVSPPLATFSSLRLFLRLAWREVTTMCLLTREITQTGKGEHNAPDGQDVDPTVWFKWLENNAGGRRGVSDTARRRGTRERLRVTLRNWALGVYGPSREVLRGFPAIVCAVYQMTFHTGQSFKEKRLRPNKTQ